MFVISRALIIMLLLLGPSVHGQQALIPSCTPRTLEVRILALPETGSNAHWLAVGLRTAAKPLATLAA